MPDRAVENPQVTKQSDHDDQEVVGADEKPSSQGEAQGWRWHGGRAPLPPSSNHPTARDRER